MNRPLTKCRTGKLSPAATANVDYARGYFVNKNQKCGLFLSCPQERTRRWISLATSREGRMHVREALRRELELPDSDPSESAIGLPSPDLFGQCKEI